MIKLFALVLAFTLPTSKYTDINEVRKVGTDAIGKVVQLDLCELGTTWQESGQAKVEALTVKVEDPNRAPRVYFISLDFTREQSGLVKHLPVMSRCFSDKGVPVLFKITGMSYTGDYFRGSVIAVDGKIQ